MALCPPLTRLLTYFNITSMTLIAHNSVCLFVDSEELRKKFTKKITSHTYIVRS